MIENPGAKSLENRIALAREGDVRKVEEGGDLT